MRLGARNHGLAASVLDLIGNTPAVELSRLCRDLEGSLVAKLEYLSPGFSKKDRVALRIIRDAEASGELNKGQAVVELTSGNTGTGLAIVCAITGHPFVAVMSRGNSIERVTMMQALGAEVVLVDQAAGGLPGAVSGDDLALVEIRAQEETDLRRAFRADQFQRVSNRDAHAVGTARELIEQTGGVDAFCDFVGTGGTYAGVAASLKAFSPSTACYVVEPAGAAVLASSPVTNASHRIQGGGYAIRDLALMADAPIDGYITVEDDEAITTARRLAAEEGIFAGFSSGAVVAAARRLLKEKHAGDTVGVIIADSGLKYLSTDLWARART